MMQQGGEQGKQNLGGEEAPIAPSPSAHSWMETLVEDEDTLLDYFLGGENGDGTSCIPNSERITNIPFEEQSCRFKSSPDSNSPAVQDYSKQAASSTTALLSAMTSEPSVAAPHPVQDDHRVVQHDESQIHVNEVCSSTIPTPCTPAVQFYPSTCPTSQRKNVTSFNVSGAISPSNNGAALSHQEKLVQQQQQFQQMQIQKQGKINCHHPQESQPHPQQKETQNQSEQFQRQLHLQQLQVQGQQQQLQQQQLQQQNMQQQVLFPTAQSSNYLLSSNHPASTSTSASSSSLSLQGMGSAPILQVHQQFQSQPTAPMSSENIADMSPISPALMCTNEVLMLPPAGQGYDPTTTSYNQTTGTMPSQSTIGTMHAQNWQNQASSGNVNPRTMNPNPPSQMNGGQMQLPAWLQHMNNVATLASQVGSAVSPSSSKQMPLSHGQQGLSYVTNQSRMNMNVNIGSHRNIYSGGTHVFPTPDILPIPSNVTAMAHSVFFKDDQALESTEKRQKRLARNRESARQSRRRKKEMLLNLRSQVSRLHNDIEYIRKGKLETMEHDLMVDKFRILNEVFLDQTCVGQSKTSEDKIASVIRNSGPNIAERRAAIEHQYKTLQKVIFPHYRRLILSLSLNDRNFFMDAKEQKVKTQKTTGRVSSKQVGEDISKFYSEKNSKDNSGKSNLSCSASDRSQFWPLLCYELSIGIDQEEKILQVLENLQVIDQVEESRRKIASSLSVIKRLQESLLAHSASVANQNQTALLEILTPSQSNRFMEWFLRNRDRCARMIDRTDVRTTIPTPICNVQLNEQLPKAHSDHSLNDICKHLTIQ